MKLDYDYIASILNVFFNSEDPDLSIYDLKDAGINFEIDDLVGNYLNEKFIFHMQRLMDMKLISDPDGNFNGLKTIGITFANTDYDTYTIENTKMQLTQKGYDFAKALKNKEVLSKIKNELKDANFESIFHFSQKMCVI